MDLVPLSFGFYLIPFLENRGPHTHALTQEESSLLVDVSSHAISLLQREFSVDEPKVTHNDYIFQITIEDFLNST